MLEDRPVPIVPYYSSYSHVKLKALNLEENRGSCAPGSVRNEQAAR